MVAISSLAAGAAAIAATYVSGAAAAPTNTTNTGASRTVALTGVRHSVVAGLGGQLIFSPDNIVASVGDVVEVHFLQKNHSFAQSSFDKPCVPINDNAFFSGFLPTNQTQNPNVFTLVINDTNPIWFYCAQTTGKHCQNGMNGAINQNFNPPTNLAGYRQKAALTNTSIAPPRVQGGLVHPNPNPLGGF